MFEYSMPEISGRALSFLLVLSFLTGCFVGYKFKSWGKLQRREIFWQEKQMNTQQQTYSATAI